MVIHRGQIWWADLPDPAGSGPGFRRPVLVLQADSFNQSRIQTVIVLSLTSNLRLLNAPGNVLIPKSAGHLEKDSVANVSQLYTIDKTYFTKVVGKVSKAIMSDIENGLKLVLSLD
jgi:mRNA interferase MazF